MAIRIPRVQSFGTPDIRPRTSFSSGAIEAAQGRLGESFQNLGENVGRIGANLLANANRDAAETERKEKERNDKLRIEQAYNSVQSNIVDLTVGEQGYSRLKGNQIVGNATPILKGYLDKYDSAVNKASTDLTEDQKTAFKLRTDDQRVNFSSNFLRHSMAEDEQYAEDTLVGTMGAEEKAATVNWYNQGAIDKSKQRIREVTQTALAGKPADLIETKINASYEKLNASIVAQALKEGNVDYAKQYMTNNSHEMGIDDLVRFGTGITKKEQDDTVNSVVSNVMGGVEEKFAPSDFKRLVTLVAHQESGNRDFGPDGRAITSPKGALFSMQVMPETAANPGYGIRRAQSGTASEFNRVGTEKLAVMVRVYNNDIPKALGAYNWGEGNVNKAVKKAMVYNSAPSAERAKTGNKTWLDFAPEETQKYVTTVMNRYSRGDNANPTPTIVDVKKQVEANLQGQPQEVIDRAKNKAEAVFNDNKQAFEQKQEAGLQLAKQQFDNGEITSVEDLKPDQLAILGDKKERFQSYIDSARKRQDDLLAMSPAATDKFFELKSNVKALIQHTPSELMGLAKDIGHTRTNELIRDRQKMLDNPGSEISASVDSDQLKTTAMRFGYDLSSSKDKQKLLFIEDKAKGVITDFQNSTGKPVTREDKSKILNRLFVEFPEVKTGEEVKGWTIFGSLNPWDKSIKTDKQSGYQVKNTKDIVIPEDFKVKVQKMYQNQGRTASDNDLLELYSEMLSTQQQKEQ